MDFSKCQICFAYAADWDGGQCNSESWDGTSFGSGVICAPFGQWMPRYRDDTDDRPGGCRMSWKIDCAP